MRLACLLVLLAAPAAPVAADCPPAPDIRPAIDALLAELRAAPSEAAARAVSGRMWAEWTRAPDARAQELLSEGMTRGRAGDARGARAALEALVAYCPGYAEGWNQLAILDFVARDFAGALAHVDRVLALDPRHVGALSGKGMTLLALGREAEAHDALRAALALNPWLAERRLLPDAPAPQIDL